MLLVIADAREFTLHRSSGRAGHDFRSSVLGVDVDFGGTKEFKENNAHASPPPPLYSAGHLLS